MSRALELMENRYRESYGDYRRIRQAILEFAPELSTNGLRWMRRRFAGGDNPRIDFQQFYDLLWEARGRYTHVEGNENWYAFSPKTVTEAELKAHDISFERTLLHGEEVFMVNTTNLPKVINTFELQYTRSMLTELTGIYFIDLFDKENKRETVDMTASMLYTVTASNWEGKEEAKFVEITRRMLTSATQKNIVLSVPHGRTRELPTDSSKFHVYIWSSTDTGGTMAVPSRLFGLLVDCRDTPEGQPFNFVAQGIPIFDTEGHECAAVTDNALYIYHDICERGSERELKIYAEILKRCAAILRGDVQSIDELTKKVYVGYCGERISKELKQLEREVKDMGSQCEKVRKQYIESMRQLDVTSRRIVQLSEMDKHDVTVFDKEFDHLASMEKVKSVSIRGSKTLTVLTDVLYCKHPKTKKYHEIGAMNISINMEGGDMRIYNCTRRVDAYQRGMHAPHVFPRGDLCQGNLAKTIPQLLARYEFTTLVMLAIQFIESINLSDSAGSHLGDWPLKSPNPLEAPVVAAKPAPESVTPEPTNEATVEGVEVLAELATETSTTDAGTPEVTAEAEAPAVAPPTAAAATELVAEVATTTDGGTA